MRKVVSATILIVLGMLSISSAYAQTKTSGLFIKIIRPGEGETLYSSGSLMFVGVPVTGMIAAENGNLDNLQVRLDVIQGNKSTGSLTTLPKVDGTFSFDVGINHNKFEQEANAEKGCASNCHSGLSLILPNGRVMLRVTVTDPAGNIASAERAITVDQSSYVDLPVQVIFDGEARAAGEGIVVTAKTQLYLWRAREYSAKTDANGRAVINVERLQEAPTHYVIQIEPRVINGAMPTSRAPIQVTVPAGATQVAPVTLAAELQRGQIQGALASFQNRSDLTVRVISASGATYNAKTSQGKFTFPNLPLAKYLVTVDDVDAMAQGIQVEPQTLDLTSSPMLSTTLKLAIGSTRAVRGIIRDNQGNPLPFAWLANDQEDKTARVSPISGEFILEGLTGRDRALWVTAPGYWSQPVALLGPLDISLTPQSDTRILPWGSGRIVVPALTLADVARNKISIKRGWVWGKGMGDFTIHTPELDVTMQSGTFALEYLSGETNWLYLIDGQAQVSISRDEKPIAMNANQMLATGKGVAMPSPVALDGAAVRALYAGKSSPVAIELDSSPLASIRDSVEQMGIPFVPTLIIASLAIVLAFGWNIWRRRSTSS